MCRSAGPVLLVVVMRKKKKKKKAVAPQFPAMAICMCTSFLLGIILTP